MRRTIDITIPPDGGRDKGKVFRITEMPAAAAEEWAMRTIMALTKAGVDIPEGTSGMAGIAAVAFKAMGVLNFAEVKVLLDEMFSCIACVPDPKHVQLTRALVEDDTEEVQTRLRLRAEVFKLHTGFSVPGALSTGSILTPEPKLNRTLRRRMSRRQSRQ